MAAREQRFTVECKLPPSGLARFPMSDDRARLWLPLIGPTAWMVFEHFNRFFDHVESDMRLPVVLQELADDFALPVPKAWVTIMRLQDFGLLTPRQRARFSMCMGMPAMHAKAYGRLPQSVRDRNPAELVDGWVR